MEGRKEAGRLGVVVSPPLLRDTLARALRSTGADVVVADELDALGEGVELVIVSDPHEAASVRVVIRIPQAEDRDVGVLRVDGGAPQPVSLPDVDSIVALCARWSGSG